MIQTGNVVEQERGSRRPRRGLLLLFFRVCCWFVAVVVVDGRALSILVISRCTHRYTHHARRSFVRAVDRRARGWVLGAAISDSFDSI
eukprot:scaffold10860_cov182-Amphora_coffeaeformis.AAC.2